MKFITLDGLKQLENYKYISGKYTWLDNKVDFIFVFVANKLPLVFLIY